MKLIIARFFDRRLSFELGNAVTEVELKTRFREREFAREAVGSAGFVVRIWVRAWGNRITTEDTDMIKLSLIISCSVV